MCAKPKPWQCILAVLLLLLVFGVFITFAPIRFEVQDDIEITVYGQEAPEPPEAQLSPRPRPRVPSVMLDLFHRGPHGQIPAEIVRSLTPRTIDPMNHRYPEGKAREHLHLLTFDIPRLVHGETLHSAQLRLTLAFLDWNLRPARDIESIVRVYWDSTEAILSQRVCDQAVEHRVTFNCTDLIGRFHRLQASNGEELQLVVGVTLAPGQKVHPLVSGEHVDKQPLLLLLYSPSPHSDNNTTPLSSDYPRSRLKRESSTEDYEEETNQVWAGPPLKSKQRKPRSLCRRKPLYVEFSDIHYDTWIVAPSGYQAFQCVGKCMYPLSDHLTPTKHAIIQTLLNSLHPSKTQRSCCVPTRLDSISVLYLDSQGVLTYRLSYKDMVVAECGCR